MSGRGRWLLLLLLWWVLPAQAREVVVSIQGEDASELVERLNKHGAKRELEFRHADEGFEFRIAVAAEAMTTADFIFFGSGADASVAVLTPECGLVFAFSRGGRMTRDGALNALSKEIVKRLAKFLDARDAVERSRAEAEPESGTGGP